MGSKPSIAGSFFGRLKAVSPITQPGGRELLWECVCLCGGTALVAQSSLVHGKTKSCGCLRREKSSKTAHEVLKKVNRTHGKTYTSEYSVWQGMLSRCRNQENPNFKRYGGRGIEVCERWLDFEAFFEDIGPRPSMKHTLDRRDVNGNYEPGNCRWATPLEQASNKSTNHLLEFNGEVLTMSEWARRLGITPQSLNFRVKNWGMHRALTTPKKSYNRSVATHSISC